MNKYERGFRPLAEIEEAKLPDIKMDLSLPEWVDKERIGINLRGIYTMCKAGGIEKLRVVTVSGEETSGFVPTVVGMNPDGSAIAGKTGFKKKVDTHLPGRSNSEHRSTGIKLHDLYTGNIYGREWIDASVILNRDEIEERILGSSDRSLRSTENWASQINSAIKGGISEAGKNHVFYNVPVSEKTTAIMAMVGAILTESGLLFEFHPRTPQISDILTSMFNFNILINAVESLATKSKKPDKKYRYGFFLDLQIDKVLALSVMERTLTLAKELPRAHQEAFPNIPQDLQKKLS
jgi:hypothetical protein